MTIKDVKQEKEILKDKITDLVLAYEKLTKTVVNDIDLKRETFMDFEGAEVNAIREIKIEVIL